MRRQANIFQLLLLLSLSSAQIVSPLSPLPAVKIKIDSSELDKSLLLEKLNQHGADHGLKFVEANEGFDYRVTFDTFQHRNTAATLAGAGAVHFSGAEAKVYDPQDKLLFGFTRETRYTDTGAANAAAKEIIKRLLAIRLPRDPGHNSQAASKAQALPGTASSASNTAMLDISSMPPDADIELDGGFAGNTPSSIGVAGGEHALRITKKGFVPWEKKIRSSSGTIRVVAELEPLSATPASAGPAAVAPHQMIVSATPTESNPNTPQPTPQVHPAILSNAERPTTLATAEGNSSIDNGTVSITSSPDGAEIFVDSIGSGHAPALLKVKPGKHTVQLVLSGYEDLVDEIDVKGGSIVNVTGKMENVEGSKSRLSNVSTLNDVAVSPQIASIGVFSDGNPNLRHDGVTLTSVSAGGPADQAGIKVGDVILAISNHYLFTFSELKEEIRKYSPGTKVVVQYRRDSTINYTNLVVGQIQ